MADWSVREDFVPGVDRGVECSICHSDLRTNLKGIRERAITTGELIEMEGLFTICETCLVEGAYLIGMIPSARAETLQKRNRELGMENKRLRERLEIFEKAHALVQSA